MNYVRFQEILQLRQKLTYIGTKQRPIQILFQKTSWFHFQRPPKVLKSAQNLQSM